MSTKGWILLVCAAVVLAAAYPAYAILGIGDTTITTLAFALPSAHVDVHDLLGEDSLHGIQQADYNIDHNTYTTMQSVTTGGGSGTYASNAGTISDLNSTLWSSVNPQKLSSLYPGWQAWSANSSAENANLTTTTLSMYYDAMGVAQRQTQEIQNEDFSGIESNLGSPNILTVMQAVGEAELQVAQQLQYQRQLQATQIAIAVTQAAETLNEKSREAASDQRSMANLFSTLF